MPVSDPTGTNVVQLSRAEQWVVHHVILESLGLADGAENGPSDSADPPESTLTILEKLEDGSFEFTSDEMRFIQQVCSNHANSTQAAADRNLASSIVDRIDIVMADRAVRKE